ncbi:class E sortase [Candidatus Saccharibacteria bacterium]|nr:class E sortase [Candidatus Saccharibacteria bacterium]
MKYHYQKGASGKSKSGSRLKNALWIIVPCLTAGIGIYILITAFSPSFIVVPFSDEQARVEERLNSKPGIFGNRLYIPQINVDVAIVEGNDESVLDRGAWHRQPQNGNPEKGGNFVLSAHRFLMGWTPQETRAKSPFYNIGRLKVGDQLFVDYKGSRYAYKITRKYEVKPTAVEIEAKSEKAKLTLYSCTLEGAADGRDVIEAEPLGKVDKVQATEPGRLQ